MAIRIRRIARYKRNGRYVASHRQRYHCNGTEKYTRKVRMDIWKSAKPSLTKAGFVANGKPQWTNINAGAGVALAALQARDALIPNPDEQKLMKAQLEQIKRGKRIQSRFNKQAYQTGELQKRRLQEEIKLLEAQRNRL